MEKIPTNRREYGMTLVEMLIFLSALIGGFSLSGFIASSYHWLLGLLCFPIGVLAVIGFGCAVSYLPGHRSAKIKPGFWTAQRVLLAISVGAAFAITLYTTASLEILPTKPINFHGHNVISGSHEWHSSVLFIALLSSIALGFASTFATLVLIVIRHERTTQNFQSAINSK